MKLIMTRGLPGSGKSTWAREQCDKEPGKWKLVDKDSLRKLLDNGRWSKGNEKFVLSVRDHIISEALRQGLNVIVHDTNFEPAHEQRLRELAKGHQFIVKDFDVDLNECIRRDLKRVDSVGEAVIRSMHSKYVAEPVEPPSYLPGVPEAIIVDLDGTLAIIGDRSPYDASSCEKDALNTEVRDVISFHKLDLGRAIILMSGRQEKDREPTERWLQANDVFYDRLIMRATDDPRKDSVVKRELFERHVEEELNVMLVIDDRQQVVNMWRSLGLQCWQVAEGNF